VFETAARSVVGLADYVEGGANGGYTPRGTGVVWSGFGYVICNFHVVSANYLPGAPVAKNAKNATPGELRVNVPDEQTGDAVWYDAVVVGTQRASDIAVLRLSPVTGAAPGALSKLRAMPIGTSDTLRVGQSCYAVGAGDTSGADGVKGVSSFRQQTTLSAGVVSGLRWGPARVHIELSR
jgi:S1-C subfamily serine protease